jgi:hypothetical protein
MRLTAHAKLQASGLFRLDQHGELCVLERLVSLIRQDVPPSADFYDQLLGAIAVDPLPWESFEHLGREADVVASVLQAALAGRESGINILLYGPPGTGKTSFAATLAARTGALDHNSRGQGRAPRKTRWGFQPRDEFCSVQSSYEIGRNDEISRKRSPRAKSGFSSPLIFRLFQQYPPRADLRACAAIGHFAV